MVKCIIFEKMANRIKGETIINVKSFEWYVTILVNLQFACSYNLCSFGTSLC